MASRRAPLCVVYVIVMTCGLPTRRGRGRMLLVSGAAALASPAALGVTVVSVGLGGLYWLVAGTVFSILAALLEAWVLLVEINR